MKALTAEEGTEITLTASIHQRRLHVLRLEHGSGWKWHRLRGQINNQTDCGDDPLRKMESQRIQGDVLR